MSKTPGKSEFNEAYEISNNTCYICNGFYGPSFEEPVCATCHLFLFPEAWSCTMLNPIFSEKTDDGDSGNDEPTDSFCVNSSSNHSLLATPEGPQPTVKQNVTPPSGDVQAQPEKTDEEIPALVLSLPPEVLLLVFSFLDDMSLWSAGNVCKRWHQLLQSHLPSDVWLKYTKRRFPIFKPLYIVHNWFKVYTALMNSCPCKACLLQMSTQSQPPGEETSWRRNRLRSELKSLKVDPPQGISAIPLDNKYCHWQASITGPVGSPYEGGLFFLYLQVSYSYPMNPPVVRFLTKIFHPNVSRHGDVGLDSIHHNWSLALTISKILISVQSLLTDPYCDVCMEPGVGKLYQDDITAFCNIARSWTWKYAMHDVLAPPDCLTSSSIADTGK